MDVVSVPGMECMVPEISRRGGWGRDSFQCGGGGGKRWKTLRVKAV